DKVYVADPAKGKVTYRKEEFLQAWLSASGRMPAANGKANGQSTGVALLLHPTPRFHELNGEEAGRLDFGILLRYVAPYRNLLFQLALGLLAGSLLQLIFPFLTQAVVDIGINTRDLNFIYLILA